MTEFASANYTAGQLNAVVKLLKKQGGEEGVDRFLRGELVVSEPVRKKLLKFICTVFYPAVDKFVTAEKFREGETVDGIKVAWLGNNFRTNFLKKVEKSVPALIMREHGLVTKSCNSAIIAELGGEEQVKSFLAHFWEHLKTADRKLWHVRYISDANGVPWAVYGRWNDVGLYVEANPLGDPLDWRVGSSFLSRWSCQP